MPINYDDIDFCLNILMDIAYNKDTQECYEIDYAKTNDVIEIFKKNKDYDYEPFFNTDFSYVGKNKDRLLFKRVSKSGFPMLIKVKPYDKNASLNDFHSKEMVDMIMNYRLGGLSLETQTQRFILYPILNFDIKMSELNVINKLISGEIKKNYTVSPDDYICIQSFENYFKLFTLRQYLDENIKNMNSNDIKSIIFQVLYILYKIQTKYPSFRHNDLDIDSIYGYVLNGEDTYDEFTVSDKSYVVPVKFAVKLTNFYNSNIIKYIDNRQISMKSDNPYYDVHYFLTSLFYYLKDSTKTYNDVYGFIDEIIPDKYKSTNKNNIGLDEAFYLQDVSEIQYPKNIIIKNNFFTDLIKDTMSSKKIANKRENVRSYGSKDSSVDYMLSSSITDSDNLSKMNLARKTSGKHRGKKRSSKLREYGLDNTDESESSSVGEISEEKKIDEHKEEEHEVKKEKKEKKHKKEKKEKKDGEDDSSSSEEEDDNEDENEDEDVETDDDDDITEDGARGTNLFMNSFNNMNNKMGATKKNNIFSSIEKMGNAKITDQERQQRLQKLEELKRMSEGGKKKGKKGKKVSKSMKPRSQVEEDIMSRLPEGYEGALPHDLEMQLSTQGMMGNPMMQQQMMASQNMMPMSSTAMNPIMNGMDNMGGMAGAMGMNPMMAQGMNPMMAQAMNPSMVQGMNPSLAQAMMPSFGAQNDIATKNQSVFLPQTSVSNNGMMTDGRPLLTEGSQQMPIMSNNNMQHVPMTEGAPLMSDASQGYESMFPKELLLNNGKGVQIGGKRQLNTNKKSKDFFF